MDHGSKLEYVFSFILAVHAFVVFKASHPPCRLSRPAFTEHVCLGLIRESGQERRRAGRPSCAPDPPCLPAKHFVKFKSIPNNRRLRCVVCGKLSRQRGIFRAARVSTHCPACNVVLCRRKSFPKVLHIISAKGRE